MSTVAKRRSPARSRPGTERTLRSSSNCRPTACSVDAEIRQPRARRDAAPCRDDAGPGEDLARPARVGRELADDGAGCRCTRPRPHVRRWTPLEVDLRAAALCRARGSGAAACVPDGGGVRVTFETASRSVLSNHAVRISGDRCGTRRIPASMLRSRSARGARWPASSRVPTRNWRYSSFRVGARKPQPTLAQTLARLGDRKQRRHSRRRHAVALSGSVGRLFGVGSSGGVGLEVVPVACCSTGRGGRRG